MNNIENALSELRKEPQSENRDNVLEQFNGMCLHCLDVENIPALKQQLLKSMKYYGFSEIAEKTGLK